jgi:hypothetical protein
MTLLWIFRAQLIFLALVACLAALNWATSGPAQPTQHDERKRHH